MSTQTVPIHLETSLVHVTKDMKEMALIAQVGLIPNTAQFYNSYFFTIDLNECLLTHLNDCHNNATCTDIDGSYKCDCDTGFSGDGITCDDIDECQANISNCDASAHCVNKVGSYDCHCLSGYLGDGFLCEGDTYYTSCFKTMNNFLCIIKISTSVRLEDLV